MAPMKPLVLFSVYAIVTLKFYVKISKLMHEEIEKNELLKGGLVDPVTHALYELLVVVYACAWIIVIPVMALHVLIAPKR